MKLPAFIKKWEDKRFLDKHGCVTWEQYNYYYDPDISKRANSLNKYYIGYAHTFIHPSDGYQDYGLAGVLPFHEQLAQMVEWCKENCKGKWRHDWHRGFREYYGDFTFNGIGGEDVVAFAFQDDKDAMMFKLRF